MLLQRLPSSRRSVFSNFIAKWSFIMSTSDDRSDKTMPGSDRSSVEVGRNMSNRDTIDLSTMNNEPPSRVIESMAQIVDALKDTESDDQKLFADMVDKVFSFLQSEIVRLHSDVVRMQGKLDDVYVERNELSKLLVRTQSALESCVRSQRIYAILLIISSLVIWSLILLSL